MEFRFWRASTLLLVAFCGAFGGCSHGKGVDEVSSSVDLWRAYSENPDTNRVLPNVSYAGYHASEMAIPSAPVSVNASRWARGDGITDDTNALNRAISFAKKRGGGVVFIPRGVYAIRGMLQIGSSNIILRGDGSDNTILLFQNSLSDVLGARYEGEDGPSRESEYSSVGGLVHVGTSEELDGIGRKVLTNKYPAGWSVSKSICSLDAAARRGDSELHCNTIPELSPGTIAVLRWTNVADHSLLHEIIGLPDFPWSSSVPKGFDSNDRQLFKREYHYWPVEIDSVKDRTIRLRQPLRLAIRPEWRVEVFLASKIIREVGVENLTIQMKAHSPSKHHDERGYSAIYFNKVVDGWVRNVKLVNVENGFVGAAIKRVTVENVEIAMTPDQVGLIHHGTRLMNESSDVQFSYIRILSPTLHGLEVSHLSNGSVWRRAKLLHGTFDYHGQTPYDLIRTASSIYNDGERGGGVPPTVGARIVHWNVTVGGSGKWVFDPNFIPVGALVGVRGVPKYDSPKYVSASALVLDQERAPAIQDVFEAQLRLRLRRNPCEIITCSSD